MRDPQAITGAWGLRSPRLGTFGSNFSWQLPQSASPSPPAPSRRGDLASWRLGKCRSASSGGVCSL